MEVWVLKLDLEGALERDGEAEDLPLSREDRLTKGGGSLLRSPVSDLDTCGHQPSIVRDRQALNLTERGTLVEVLPQPGPAHVHMSTRVAVGDVPPRRDPSDGQAFHSEVPLGHHGKASVVCQANSMLQTEDKIATWVAPCINLAPLISMGWCYLVSRCSRSKE
ncbi:hypothetical protein GW17_00038477 [Ensete ventricosum]|nr:hypothetical protein GW17_00038477 [Ensete ventricosum]